MDGGKEWQDGEAMRGKRERGREREPYFPHEYPECDTLLRAIKRGRSTKVKTNFEGKNISFNIKSVAEKSSSFMP